MHTVYEKNVSIGSPTVMQLTIAAQKRDCCLDFQEFQLLAASWKMETMPAAGKSWTSSDELPRKQTNKKKTGTSCTD